MKVTVLVINYKNWEDTIECLESVLKSTYNSIEIIVVDNSPNTGPLENLEKWAKGGIHIKETNFPNLIFPEKLKPLKFNILSETEYIKDYSEFKGDITFIKANENKGFAAANNIVLRKILNSNRKDGFVFLLNNDTVLPSETIPKLVDCYNKSSYGIVGCALLDYTNPTLVQSVGGLYNNFWGITSQVLEGLPVADLKSRFEHIDYPVGAAMFLSVSALREIGVLNETYFLFYEELDWIKRSEKLYKSTYFKECLVYHKGGVSIGSNNKSYLADKYSIVNRIKFAKVHNRTNLVSIYFGVMLSILKRFSQLKFNRGIRLIKDILKNES